MKNCDHASCSRNKESPSPAKEARGFFHVAMPTYLSLSLLSQLRNQVLIRSVITVVAMPRTRDKKLFSHIMRTSLLR